MFQSAIISLLRLGARFKIDLPNRTCYVDGKPVEVELDHDSQTFAMLTELQRLYLLYKYSRPSEQSAAVKHPYFKALPIEELDRDDLTYGHNREESRFMLESTLLCLIKSETLTWSMLDPDNKRWFWASPDDRDFVLLREWFEKI